MPLVDAVAHTATYWGRYLLDLIFPPRCVVCQRVGTWLCAECMSRLPYVVEPICRRCGMPLQNDRLCKRCRTSPLRIEKIDSVLLFEGAVRHAVHHLKYRNGKTLAEPLGKIMSTWLNDHPQKTDLIAPVPLHPDRLRQRGYNQASLLARALARNTGIPMSDNSLARVRNTKSQMRLAAEERRHNVSNAFHCRDERVNGRQVLIIDDVCTTGATLEACADALHEAGAARVQALTLARTP